MNDQASIFTFSTRFGRFRIQPDGDKFGLFIDYPEGDFDLLTSCVSPEDGVDYVAAQDTGLAEWDSLPTESLPDQIRNIGGWEKRPFRPSV